MDIRKIVGKFGTPLYVYEENKIRKNYKLIDNSISYQNKQIHYAAMCNSNMEVLKTIKKLGAGIQINSLYELKIIKKAGFDRKQICFTSVGLDIKSLKKLIQARIQINLDSIEEVEKYCKLNPGGKFGIRIKIKENIKIPPGHTNSPEDSDVGIEKKDFPKVKKIAEQYGCKINGVHGYLASNILVLSPLIQASNYIIECAKQFPDLEYVNFGSGFGVPDKKSDPVFNFKKLGKHYSKLTKRLSNYLGKEVQLKIEPGRSITATAGTLYVTITNVKQLREKKQIAVNAGFAEFARPMIYGAYHEIEIVEKNGKRELYDIRGNTVLQSDFLGRNRQFPKVKEGDILAIKNTGAYGSVMASGFPGKTKPKEILV